MPLLFGTFSHFPMAPSRRRMLGLLVLSTTSRTAALRAVSHHLPPCAASSHAPPLARARTVVLLDDLPPPTTFEAQMDPVQAAILISTIVVPVSPQGLEA